MIMSSSTPKKNKHAISRVLENKKVALCSLNSDMKKERKEKTLGDNGMRVRLVRSICAAFKDTAQRQLLCTVA
jgi:hypothetical protein